MFAMINSIIMNLLVCIDATRLSRYALEPLAGGPRAVERVRAFTRALPRVVSTTILTDPETPPTAVADEHTIYRSEWNSAELIAALEEAVGASATGGEGGGDVEAVVYCRADTPFLDRAVAGRMIDTHYRYVSEYTFADGYPVGMTPEIVDPRILRRLRALAEKSPQPLVRDGLFDVIRKDINAFDVETELSPVDLRMLRATLACDTRRNHLLCERVASWIDGGSVDTVAADADAAAAAADAEATADAAGASTGGAADAADANAAAAEASAGERVFAVLQRHQEVLRTLPAYTSIQVVEGEVQTPIHSPYTLFRPNALEVRDEMPVERFAGLISQLSSFAPDGMVHISLWGEVGLHSSLPQLIRTVEETGVLELLVETSGVGWSEEALREVANMQLRSTRFILDLDTDDEQAYRTVRGDGFQEARRTADTLLEAHGDRVYVQAIRMQETEQQVEAFYRAWKDRGVSVIVQKYDHYCGRLADRRVSDISPVTRFPCRHTQRDLNIFLDGTVPMCREDIDVQHSLGNVFEDGIEAVWDNGRATHLRQVREEYPELCRHCDEYYTFNY